MMIVIRRKVLMAALEDPDWGPLLDGAKTNRDLTEMLIAYCAEKGLRVKYT